MAGVAVPDVPELDAPQVVVALAGVPVDLVDGDAAPGEAFGDELAEGGAGGRLAGEADGDPLGLLGDVFAFLEHRPLEPAHSLDRDARRGGDLLGRLTGTDAGLDLLGAQRALHFDLILTETGEVAADGSAEPVVDGQREAGTLPAVARTR